MLLLNSRGRKNERHVAIRQCEPAHLESFAVVQPNGLPEKMRTLSGGMHSEFRLLSDPESRKEIMKSNNHLSTKIALAATLFGTAICAGSLNAAPSPIPNPHANMPGMTSPAPASSQMTSMADDKMMMSKMDMMMKTMEQMMPMMAKMHQMMPMMMKMEQMMPMMEKMMGGMPMKDGGMPMKDGGMPMESDNMEMSSMMGMGPMGNNPPGPMFNSALPGFPGASHLYHIGATGFFLDHPQHITLTTDQQVALNKIKDQTLQAKSAADRNIEQAEQELGMLTAADQPDASKIEAKVRDITKLAADQRLAFIRAVGEAAKILTADQRKSLTGFAPPVPAMPMTPSAPAAMPNATPMSMDHM